MQTFRSKLVAFLQEMSETGVSADAYFCCALLRGIASSNLAFEGKARLFRSIYQAIPMDVGQHKWWTLEIAATQSDLSLFEQAAKGGIQLPWIPAIERRSLANSPVVFGSDGETVYDFLPSLPFVTGFRGLSLLTPSRTRAKGCHAAAEESCSALTLVDESERQKVMYLIPSRAQENAKEWRPSTSRRFLNDTAQSGCYPCATSFLPPFLPRTCLDDPKSARARQKSHNPDPRLYRKARTIRCSSCTERPATPLPIDLNCPRTSDQ